jgi:hypothetical protein
MHVVYDHGVLAYVVPAGVDPEQSRYRYEKSEAIRGSGIEPKYTHVILPPQVHPRWLNAEWWDDVRRMS